MKSVFWILIIFFWVDSFHLGLQVAELTKQLEEANGALEREQERIANLQQELHAAEESKEAAEAKLVVCLAFQLDKFIINQQRNANQGILLEI